MLFAGVFFHDFLHRTLGRDTSGILVLLLLGSFFLAIVVGSVLEFFRPWQFVVWGERHVLRAIVNYGALISVVVCAVVFYLERG